MTRKYLGCEVSCIFTAALVAMILSTGLARAQQPTGLTTDAVFQTWRKHTGVQACSRCHYEPGNAFSSVDKSFSRQNEMKFWLANDKHAIARRRVEPLTKDEVLEQAKSLQQQYGADIGIVKGWLGTSNILSHRMCEKLRYDVKDAAGYAQFQDNCLTCHGGYRSDVESDKADFATGQPGISCNYCHQIGSNDRWVDAHSSNSNETREAWRAASSSMKAGVGMRDLVTTSKQADLCFDCHIGNRSQNRFITHEMYAAGHPPLPSIELQTFCDQMPQHWRTLSEVHEALPEPMKDSYFQTNFPGTQNADVTFWNTRKMLIGALAARVKTLDLVLQSAEMNQWADYALYDCAACHHELKTVSRRQQRGYPAAPGRPRQPEWPDSLFHIGLFLVKDEPAIMSTETALSQRFGEQPFGDPARVSVTANELRAQIEQAIKMAETTPVDAEIARGVLRGLAQTPTDKLLVYDSARQVVWAIRVIAAEMEAEGIPLDDPLKQLIAGLDQPQIAPGSIGLSTTLPAGRQKFIYPDGLRGDLDRRANFDPDTLEARLREINTLLTADIRRRSQRLVSQPAD